MAPERRRFSLMNKDGANSSAHWTLGSNEFPTENLLSDPHSPLPLYRCAFELHSEPLWLTPLMALRRCVCAVSLFLCFIRVGHCGLAPLLDIFFLFFTSSAKNSCGVWLWTNVVKVSKQTRRAPPPSPPAWRHHHALWMAGGHVCA